MNKQLPIGGMVPFSATDYPEKLSAVIFCQGCPWRCRYCHNPHLQPISQKNTMQWEEVLSFLKTRQNLLEAVVFSGGEPILHPELPPVIQEVKQLGFKVGLHTSGAYPSQLKKILPFVDWVGMDIKAPFEKYESITLRKKSGKTAEECARYIIESNVAYEFRTTVHSDLLSQADLEQIAHALQKIGAKHYALQNFKPGGCEDAKLCQNHLDSHFSLKAMQKICSAFATFAVR
ncbi:MAG TPA: anaerobic ribonucleoside-triphosphate reductase activating protein [Rhabdochlamydiaceae bacterium]|nr:anaerobic ribonucleoside-triphosphate reductase activating protein [Rhabdochlamydiaceae bacterium]